MGHTHGNENDARLLEQFQHKGGSLYGWVSISAWGTFELWIGGNGDTMSRRAVEDYGGERFPIEVKRAVG